MKVPSIPGHPYPAPSLDTYISATQDFMSPHYATELRLCWKGAGTEQTSQAEHLLWSLPARGCFGPQGEVLPPNQGSKACSCLSVTSAPPTAPITARLTPLTWGPLCPVSKVLCLAVPQHIQLGKTALLPFPSSHPLAFCSMSPLCPSTQHGRQRELHKYMLCL